MESKLINLCYMGKLDELKEMYQNYNINIHCCNDEAFKVSCISGYLSVAQWLHLLGGIDIIAYNDAFRCSCGYGHLNVVQWLYSLGGININAYNDAFKSSCISGHLSVAQWLYSLGCVNTHFNNDDSFIWSRGHGHLNVAQWLHLLGGIDIIAYNDAFKLSCGYGYLNVAQLLLLIYKFDNTIVDENLAMQYYDYAFSLGYLPTNKMIHAYAEYKNKIRNEMKEKNENGNIGVFELSYLVDIIMIYV